jgi:glycosyltransferase involved in cell wall biosynthesis
VKVLILHQHFRTPYEGGAIRSYYLAKALVDHGIHATIITGYNGRDYRQKSVDGIDVHYLPIRYDNSFGFYRRGFAFLQYLRKSIRLAMSFKGIDFCYAMSVPLTVGVAGKSISSRFKIPMIFEVGDLWPDAPIEMGFIKRKMLQTYLMKLEKDIYNASAKIVALSPSIADRIVAKTPGKEIAVISNMSDTQFFQLEPKREEFIRKYNVENKFVISYTGAIGFANGLDHFLTCAKQAQANNLPVQFILCGEGAELGKLKAQIRELDLVNLSYFPLVNREGVKEILNVSDACFISYAPFSILETGSPNKYFDALAAGKLVIVNFDGWIRKEIEASQCGIFIDRKSPASFVEQIQPFLFTPMLKNYQLAARRLAETSYSRKKLGEKFASLFKKSL